MQIANVEERDRESLRERGGEREGERERRERGGGSRRTN